MEQRFIELLSPARNKETAFAAIDCGADAVYMGFERFGARVSAGNSLEDIREVVNYAHLFGVKVYAGHAFAYFNTVTGRLCDNSVAATDNCVIDSVLLYKEL